MSFLDANVFGEQGKFIITLFGETTCSVVYTNFDSVLLDTYKTGMIYTLLNRCTTFHSQVIF